MAPRRPGRRGLAFALGATLAAAGLAPPDARSDGPPSARVLRHVVATGTSTQRAAAIARVAAEFPRTAALVPILIDVVDLPSTDEGLVAAAREALDGIGRGSVERCSDLLGRFPAVRGWIEHDFLFEGALRDRGTSPERMPHLGQGPAGARAAAVCRAP